MNANIQPAQAQAARQAKIDLAACHRLAVRFGLNEGIDNHLTLLVPGCSDRFYLAPFGLHWSEVRAADFMEIDFYAHAARDRARHARESAPGDGGAECADVP